MNKPKHCCDCSSPNSAWNEKISIHLIHTHIILFAKLCLGEIFFRRAYETCSTSRRQSLKYILFQNLPRVLHFIFYQKDNKSFLGCKSVLYIKFYVLYMPLCLLACVKNLLWFSESKKAGEWSKRFGYIIWIQPPSFPLLLEWFLYCNEE